MSLPKFFGLLGGLVVLAFVANRQFPRTRIPDVVVLLLVGLILGPLTGVVDASRFQDVTHAFGTLAIILILFEGGLDLKLRETLRHFPGGLLLAALSFIVSTTVVAMTTHWGLNLAWLDSIVIGAVLGCTSSAILLPVLQQLKMRDEVKMPLFIESSVTDVLSVISVGLLLEFAAQGGPILRGFLGGVLWELLASLLLAGAAGMLWQGVLPLLSDPRFWNILTFAAILLLYSAAESLGASGLIAVLGFGLTLSNLTHLREEQVELVAHGGPDASPLHLQVHSFHSELAFLVRTFFFVLLGAVVKLEGLRGNLLFAAGTLAALFAARWVALLLSSGVRKTLTAHEREMLVWMMPRGLVTAVLAIQVLEARGAHLFFLPAVAFAVIVVTNVALVIGIFRGHHGAPEAMPENSI